MEGLERRCSRDHEHEPISGHTEEGGQRRLRSEVAGAYPEELCRSLANLVKKALTRHRGERTKRIQRRLKK